MRFLILNTDYPDFLGWLYAQHPGLEHQSYEEQMRVRMESLFGVADFYSSNLKKLGHEAWDIHANNEFMQRAWAKETRVQVEERSIAKRRWQQTRRIVQHVTSNQPLRYMKRLIRPLFDSLNGHPSWFYEILAAQIEYYRPDVLLNQEMGINGQFLREVKPYVRLLIGQHAATRLPESQDWSCYNLVISSFLPTLEFFRQIGVRSELARLCFEPKILSCLPRENRTLDITFIGSFHTVHRSRTAFLEILCRRFPQIGIWGPGISSLSCGSPIRKCYEGEAWGREMYQIFHKSKIVLNHHGDIAPYANNLRLYEATGVGALLITDWKEDLQHIFEPGKQVVAYRSLEECIELISYYLERDEERESIARAGQARVLREHTYARRMEEFVAIVGKHI